MLILSVLLASLSPVDADPARAADEAILQRLKTETWPTFYRDQDVDGLSAFLAPEFVNLAPDGSAVTRAQELLTVGQTAWSPTEFQYVVDRIDWFSDDLVQVTGRGSSLRNVDGAPCRHGYFSSNLLRRDEDAPTDWVALSSHVSGVACTPIAE